MSDDEARPPHFLLTALFALWAMAFLYSFVAFLAADPEGSGFTRGANRIASFLGWQGVAGLLALCVFGVARNWPPGTSVRRLALVPLGLAGVLGAALLLVVAWAMAKA